MKFGPFFLATVAIGALVGWFAPDMTQPGVVVPGQTVLEPEDRLDVARSEPHGASEVALQRDDSGHFYAEVSSDTGNVMMLVDTGATVVALTANDAAMMGVEWPRDRVRPVARGASGDVYGARIMLDRIAVGGIEARHVQAVVVPEGLDISLLGQSFLAQVDRVEVTGDRMVLHD